MLEGIYIAGPVLIVAGIGGLISISAAVVACGAFALIGTAMFVVTPASRAWRPERDGVRGLAGALASPGVRTLLATMGELGIGIGVIEVAVPALCERAEAPSATGFVFGLTEAYTWLGTGMGAGIAAGAALGGTVVEGSGTGTAFGLAATALGMAAALAATRRASLRPSPDTPD